MITEKIYGTLGKTNKQVEKVFIEWFERDKRILRKITSDGEEIGIKSEKTLNDGDIVFENDEKIIAVEILPSDLIEISVSTMQEMGKLCFELGNRHISIAVSENSVRCPYDEPTYEYLKKLGFSVKNINEKFTGYTECKGHSHH